MSDEFRRLIKHYYLCDEKNISRELNCSATITIANLFIVGAIYCLLCRPAGGLSALLLSYKQLTFPRLPS